MCSFFCWDGSYVLLVITYQLVSISVLVTMHSLLSEAKYQICREWLNLSKMKIIGSNFELHSLVCLSSVKMISFVYLSVFHRRFI